MRASTGIQFFPEFFDNAIPSGCSMHALELFAAHQKVYVEPSVVDCFLKIFDGSIVFSKSSVGIGYAEVVCAQLLRQYFTKPFRQFFPRCRKESLVAFDGFLVSFCSEVGLSCLLEMMSLVSAGIELNVLSLQLKPQFFSNSD